MDIVEPRRVFVGLDYHDEQVQVCVVDHERKRLLDKPIANAWGVIVGVVRPLGEVQGVALEACCGAGSAYSSLASHCQQPRQPYLNSAS